jgi:hypothetical protein
MCVLEQYVIEGIEFLRELRVKKEIEREDFAAELEAMQKVGRKHSTFHTSRLLTTCVPRITSSRQGD